MTGRFTFAALSILAALSNVLAAAGALEQVVVVDGEASA